MIQNSPWPRIEICGGIASGKTSLASLLSKIGLQTILENFSSNPFFSDFYSDPRGFAFETEITFLLQHFSSVRTKRSEGIVSVFDFSLALDLAYAHVTLSSEDQGVFGVVLRASVKKIGTPDLLIRLRCESEEKLRRIKNRGRAQEQGIDRDYLEKIELALDGTIFSVPFLNTPVLEIDSQHINFVSDSSGIFQVCREIQERLETLGHQIQFDQEQCEKLKELPQNSAKA